MLSKLTEQIDKQCAITTLSERMSLDNTPAYCVVRAKTNVDIDEQGHKSRSIDDMPTKTRDNEM